MNQLKQEIRQYKQWLSKKIMASSGDMSTLENTDWDVEDYSNVLVSFSDTQFQQTVLNSYNERNVDTTLFINNDPQKKYEIRKIINELYNTYNSSLKKISEPINLNISGGVMTRYNDGRVNGLDLTKYNLIRGYANKCAVISLADGFGKERSQFFIYLQNQMIRKHKLVIGPTFYENLTGIIPVELFNDEPLDMGELLNTITFEGKSIIVVYTRSGIFNNEMIAQSMYVGSPREDDENTMIIINFGQAHFQLLNPDAPVRNDIFRIHKYFQPLDTSYKLNDRIIITNEALNTIKTNS